MNFTATGTHEDGTFYGYDSDTDTWLPIDEEMYQRARTALRPVSAIAAEMAAEGVGIPEAIWKGHGKTSSDLWSGAKDLYYRARGQEEERATLNAEQAASNAIYRELSKQRPYSTGLGEGLLYTLGGGVAGGATSLGTGLASALLRQFGAGAALGGLEHDPTVVGRVQNAALEGFLGAAGEGIGRGIGRIATPGFEKVGEEVTSVLSEAQPLGYKVMPSTLVDSNTLRDVVEGGLETMPTSAHVMNKALARNEELLNKHAAEAIGEHGVNAVSDVVLDRAEQRIGEEFQDIVGKRARFFLGDELLNDLDVIESERITPYLVGTEDPIRNVVDRTLELMTKRAGGEVTGRELYANISRLGRSATSAMKEGKADLGLGLFDLQRALFDEVQRQVPKSEFDRLTAARKQWRNMLVLQKTTDPVTGRVNARTVANRLQSTDIPGFTRGHTRDPFYTGVRFMARVQPPLQSSKTAERSALQSLVGNALTIAGPAGGYSADAILPGIGLAALPFAVPYGMAKYYTRPSSLNWLTRDPLSYSFAPGVIPPVSQQGLLGMGGIGVGHTLVGGEATQY